MSFTLPVCPFLFFSSCWKPSHFIEQIFESLNRSRADPEPNRHAARLRLRSAGMGSSPSLGRLSRRARRAAASTDVASQRQSFASCNPFNLGGCSSGEFEGFGKEEHAQPMISLLWSYISTLPGFASYAAKQAKECDLDGLRAAGVGNDDPHLTRIAGWRHFPSFSHVLTSLMSKSLAMPHWAHTTFCSFFTSLCHHGVPPVRNLREQDHLRSHPSREQYPPNRTSTGKKWPRWWHDMIQMTKAYIKIEEIGSGATWWPSDILKSEDSKGTSSQLLPKAATNATMSSRRQSVLLTAINRGRGGMGPDSLLSTSFHLDPSGSSAGGRASEKLTEALNRPIWHPGEGNWETELEIINHIISHLITQHSLAKHS